MTKKIKLLDYEKCRLKYVCKFISESVVFLHRFRNGCEVLVDMSTQPYTAILKFPITLSQEKQRSSLKSANPCLKELVRDAVLGKDGRVKLRLYGAVESDTDKTENKNKQIMSLYWTLKNFKSEDGRDKDYAYVSKIMKRMKMGRGAVRQIIERNKRRYPAQLFGYFPSSEHLSADE